MSSSVEQIKERLSIVDVISSYLKLEKAGGNYKAPCPFHNEKTPSFFISPARNSYYCFGCGAKGDIFTFVEQFEGLDFKGALQVLATRAGVEIEQYRGGVDKKDKTQKDRLYELMETACVFFQHELAKNPEALAYLEKRGVTEDTMRAFRVGFAPHQNQGNWRAVTSELRKKGFTDDEIVLAGLAKHPEKNESAGIYDRFRDRVMFPIADTGGRIIAFSGRILHDDGTQQGKYINSPETPIFKKGSTLYGLDKAKFEIRKRDFAILVEGQLDLVLSHQAGFANTVASSGTALGDSLVADTDRGLLSGLGQVHGLTKNLVIAYDADKAGLRAAGRAERIGLSLGMNVKVAKLPKDMDPADMIRLRGAAEWKKVVESAQHIVLVYLAVLKEHQVNEHTRMRAVRDKILPYLAVMPSAVERDHFIREIHKATGISETALADDLALLIQKEDQMPVRQKEASPTSIHVALQTRTSRIADRLFGIIFWQESLGTSQIAIDEIKQRLDSILTTDTFNKLYDIAPDKKNERIFEVELLYTDVKKLHSDVEELISNLEEEVLGVTLLELMTIMNDAEKNGDALTLQAALAESQRITHRLNTIKSNRFLQAY